MSIHTIIWDLGGVIIRTEDHVPRDALAARLGMNHQALNDLVFGPPGADNPIQLGQVRWEAHKAQLSAALEVPPEEVEYILGEFFGGDSLDHDLVDHIRALKHTYTTAALSNAFSHTRHMLTDVWQIDDAFHFMVISAEVGLMKPDPAIYQLAIEQSGCEAHECVFIDDAPANVQVARSAGMHAIQFNTSAQVLADLQALIQENE